MREHITLREIKFVDPYRKIVQSRAAKAPGNNKHWVNVKEKDSEQEKVANAENFKEVKKVKPLKEKFLFREKNSTFHDLEKQNSNLIAGIQYQD